MVWRPAPKQRPEKASRISLQSVLAIAEPLIRIALLIFLLVLLCLLFFRPVYIKTKFDSVFDEFIGGEYDVEVNFLGIKLARDAELTKKIADQQGEIESLNSQLALSVEKLEQVCQQTSCDDVELALRDVIATVEEKNSEQDVLARTNITFDQIPLFEAWVVFFGADGTLRAAMDEVEKVQASGYTAALLRTHTLLRTVAVFESKEAADSALMILSDMPGKDDAYIRFLPAWCEDFKNQRVENNLQLIDCNRKK